MNFVTKLWNYLPDTTHKWLLRCFYALTTFLLVWLITGKRPDIPLPPIPIDENHYPNIDGWKDDPKAVAQALAILETQQGVKPVFAVAGADLIDAIDDNAPVFFWDSETKVAGQVLPSWNQGQVGCCVSFGWGRAIQDRIFYQAATKGDKWNGKLVATEPLYGLMRVQVGKGQLGNSDGATGAWAALAVKGDVGGVLFRQVYPPNYDFTIYSEKTARLLGVKGCPADLIPLAKEHPIQTVALVKTSDEVWAAIGNGYPVPICSNVGFQSPLVNGFCAPSGSWAHCMEIRARFIHPTKGKCFVIQNSWGDYLKVNNGNNIIQVKNVNGTTDAITLPQGCFAVTAQTVNRIVAQGDSYAISDFKGFPARRWQVQNKLDNVYALSK
jgi:hypothetical protein